MDKAIIPRRIENHLRKINGFFPILSLTGPRQAGKTTLLRSMYPDFRYVSLEQPNVRAFAQNNPHEFLAKYDDYVIFDEAQRWPDLFSYLQVIVDEDRRPGRFILSGSQNFLLRKSITQSLAGRVGIAKLFPFDKEELRSEGLLDSSTSGIMHRGGYPEMINQLPEFELFFESYLESYVERDVTELVTWKNLDTFRRFLRIVAFYSGQLVNISKLAKDSGIAINTVQSWLGILEQSYIIFRLPAFFRNFGKRLTKTSKLYFYDTGLLCYLLQLLEPDDLDAYQNKGAIFENFIIADAFKSFQHQGYSPVFYYYRDHNKREVDLVYEKANLARLYEIKTADEFKPRLIKTLEDVARDWDRPVESKLIYQGDEERRHNKSMLVNWRNTVWER